MVQPVFILKNQKGFAWFLGATNVKANNQTETKASIGGGSDALAVIEGLGFSFGDIGNKHQIDRKINIIQMEGGADREHHAESRETQIRPYCYLYPIADTKAK